jgi:hypothetical protein
MFIFGPSNKCPRFTEPSAVRAALGEEQTLTTPIAYFIARGFAQWLSTRLQMPRTSLRVSVR